MKPFGKNLYHTFTYIYIPISQPVNWEGYQGTEAKMFFNRIFFPIGEELLRVIYG